ncbi:glycosyltransferase family 39 protein [Streptomyces montanus]|uniref:Glycosyltransferase family 39 protein n=1 Tax=Streptomyces montanus TaxID=2580423 RepID=A0A5R9FY76_9ACTN|nr:glycosyltransferase family 39 protein [Streptomyces montanus]TLS47689.1 glycosyltransferase family 39 protein [Streptomyces montanus]
MTLLSGRRDDEQSPAREPKGIGDVPPLARRPVFALAAAVAALLLLVSNRFGYAGDELYFIVAGRHPDWSYADQPPLLPLLSHALDVVSGGSLVALRAPSALMAAAGVVIAALVARELGGRRGAQVLAAAACALAPITLQSGHLFITNSVDVFLAILSCWLLVRWIRLRDDRLLLATAAVVAVELQVKYLAVAFWAMVFASALLFGPRELLRRPKLWIGVLLIAAVTAPALIWQAGHDWPQLTMSEVIADEVAEAGEGGIRMVPAVLASAGILGLVLLVHGLVRLIGSPRLRPYRFLGWAWVGLVVVYALSGGRGYYAASYLVVPWAAAAVDLQDRQVLRRARWRWWVAAPLTVLSLALVPVMLPLYPRDKLADTSDGVSMETVGWPEMADTVDGIYRARPATERRHTVILTDRYEQAAALDRYGPSRKLPPVYSGHRAYWYFDRPADTTRHVIYIGADADYLDRFFGTVRKVGEVDNGLGVPNINQGMSIWWCDNPRRPWTELWPQFKHMAAVTNRGRPLSE